MFAVVGKFLTLLKGGFTRFKEAHPNPFKQPQPV